MQLFQNTVVEYFKDPFWQKKRHLTVYMVYDKVPSGNIPM